MSKPEFSKPFNILDAKAGAPYCCRDGQQAEILKWDCNHQRFPLIGVVCEKTYHYPESWTVSGEQASDEEFERRPGRDLVMLPIGMCQSKPIFMGDELVTRFGDKFVVEAKHIGYLDEENTWPAPTLVYPETQACAGRLSALFDAVLHRSGIDGGRHAALHAIANSAIRHGIDNGYLLDPTTDAKNIHNAVPTFASEVERRHAIVHIERERKMIRAGIEQGWREAYLTFSEPPPPHVERRVPSAMPRSDTDVDELIASVTGAKDAKEGAQ